MYRHALARDHESLEAEGETLLSNPHLPTKVRRLHDFQSAKSIERKQIVISAANYFSLPAKSTSDDGIIIWIAADSFAKCHRAHNGQLAFKDG